MNDIGYAALVLSLLFSLYAAAVSYWGARKGFRELIESAEHAVFAVAALITISSVALLVALVRHDFSLEYVASYTNTTQDFLYLLAAFYGGNQGSLLLWAWVLGLMAALVIWLHKREHGELMPYVITVLMVTEAFFTLLMIITANPFGKLPFAVADGQGLNPLLQNMGMLIHPPTLYFGYVGFAVPFAFAMSALITGQLGDRWIKVTRRWTLFAWFFLTLGNLFGAQWAYVELGWGGFWGWDPVENASFMPWLTGTAFLHSVMIQERRGMLKVWNMVLIITTFCLTIFGTFLTRSGVISSVHSFGQSAMGAYFLVFIGGTLFVSLTLLFERLDDLRGDNELDSFVSRESAFLLNNLILIGAAFAVFWGTVFPIISEAVRGVKITVGAPFFNQVSLPIFLTLLAVMGVCPLIGWRRASKENLLRNFMIPATLGLISVGFLLWLGIREFLSILPLALCAFTAVTIVLEWIRGVGARHTLRQENYASALLNLVLSNKRRYGGYIVHLGIIMIAVGVIGVYGFKSEKSATLAKDETMNIGDYVLEYKGVSSYSVKSHDVLAASLNVYQGGKLIDRMVPVKNSYPGQEQVATEVAIRTTLKEDLYVILEDAGADGSASFKVVINPLVVWLWIGGGVLLVGTVIAFWPEAKARRRVVVEVERQESRTLQPVGS
ncbi:MAG: heme lyase CcmF/NrfE family subunit [Dehalococcoidia bacterium]|nr:heme lyase CcmF/NrfE family subunit [Dehalococcoidia bacterium]